MQHVLHADTQSNEPDANCEALAPAAVHKVLAIRFSGESRFFSNSFDASEWLDEEMKI